MVAPYRLVEEEIRLGRLDENAEVEDKKAKQATKREYVDIMVKYVVVDKGMPVVGFLYAVGGRSEEGKLTYSSQ